MRALANGLAVSALTCLVASATAHAAPGDFLVNSYTTAYQDYAGITHDAAGNFIVVWESVAQDGDASGVFAQRFDASATRVGPEFQVNSYTTENQWAARVSAAPAGSFVVTWQSYTQDGDSFGIYAQRFDSAGATTGPEFRVNSYTTYEQRFPAIATDAAGNFVVVWHSYEQDGSSFGVFARRYDASGTPLGPEFQVNTFTTDIQWYPDVASDAAGNFVVVWESYAQDGDDFGVFAQRYDAAGSPAGAEFRVSSFTTAAQWGSRVGSDSAGNFVVVWHSDAQDGDNFGIFAQRYGPSGTPTGGEFQVNSFTTDEQQFASVGVEPAGNFVVSWHSYFQDGDNLGIFAQRFDAAGMTVGPEFQVNAYTSYEQQRPAVTADGPGEFVVAWHSYAQDGEESGVFARRIACGDRAVDPGETCDDGNRMDGDGCSAECLTEIPMAVSWAEFHATATDAGVEVTWRTTLELGTAAFEVRTRSEPGGELLLGRVPARGPGFEYRYLDASDAARSGRTRSYQLVELTVEAGRGDATVWFDVERPAGTGDGSRQRGGDRRLRGEAAAPDATKGSNPGDPPPADGPTPRLLTPERQRQRSCGPAATDRRGRPATRSCEDGGRRWLPLRHPRRSSAP